VAQYRCGGPKRHGIGPGNVLLAFEQCVSLALQNLQLQLSSPFRGLKLRQILHGPGIPLPGFLGMAQAVMAHGQEESVLRSVLFVAAFETGSVQLLQSLLESAGTVQGMAHP
jgi:hypothetical protein